MSSASQISLSRLSTLHHRQVATWRRNSKLKASTATTRSRKSTESLSATPTPTAAAYAVKISNYVCNFELLKPVNAQLVSILFMGRYDRAVFTSCTVRLYRPSVTLEVFDNGKVGITGAMSREDTVLAAIHFVTELSKLTGILYRMHNLTIQNVVGSASLGYELNLELFYQDWSGQSLYLPGVFPGLPFHMKDPTLSFILFESGRMVITGAKQPGILLKGFAAMDWSKYRRGHEYRALTSAAVPKTQSGGNKRSRSRHRRHRDEGLVLLASSKGRVYCANQGKRVLAWIKDQLQTHPSCLCDKPHETQHWNPCDDSSFMCLGCATQVACRAKESEIDGLMRLEIVDATAQTVFSVIELGQDVDVEWEEQDTPSSGAADIKDSV